MFWFVDHQFSVRNITVESPKKDNIRAVIVNSSRVTDLFFYKIHWTLFSVYLNLTVILMNRRGLSVKLLKVHKGLPPPLFIVHPAVSPIMHSATIVIHGEHEHSSFSSDMIAHIRLTQIHR